MVKALIFDVYGTLISTGTGSVDAARKVLAANGRSDITPETFYARLKAYHRAHMDGFTDFVNEEAIFLMDLQAAYRAFGIPGDAEKDVAILLEPLGKRTAFPETKAVLEALAGRVTLCIGSTTDTAPLLEDLKRNDLQVHHVYTSEMLKAYKPQPRFYRDILKAQNLRPEEALFVGDSLTDDVLGPQSVGIPACWVNRKGQERGAVTPAYEIDYLCKLEDILETLRKPSCS